MVGERDPCDSTSLAFPGRIELPERSDLRGLRLGVPAELTGEGIEPGVREVFGAALELARSLGATVEPCALPHAPHALAAYYVLPRRRPPRTSRASTVSATATGRAARTTCSRCTRAPATMASARRSSGASCSAPTRSQAATTTPTTGAPQRVRTKIAEDFAAAFERFDFIVTPTAPGVAFEFGAKTADPLAMYLNDFCTVPMSPRRDPGDLDPLRSALPPGGERRCRSACRLAAPPFSENGLLAASFALEQALDSMAVRCAR